MLQKDKLNLYHKSDSGLSFLHMAVRKSYEMVFLIASNFPELINEANDFGVTPIKMLCSTMINDNFKKLKLMIALCKDDLIDLGDIVGVNIACCENLIQAISVSSKSIKGTIDYSCIEVKNYVNSSEAMQCFQQYYSEVEETSLGGAAAETFV